MLLAIDTSTHYAGVALLREGRVIQLAQWQSQRNHTVELLSVVEGLLRREGATAREVTAVAVARGPGGFSALRVGMSVAKGLALALEVPLVSATTLESEAFGYRACGRPVGAVLDAGRGEVFWAWYEGSADGLRQNSEERLGAPSELLRDAPAGSLLCGEGLERHREALSGGLPQGGALALPYVPALRVSGLAFLGWARLKEGRGEDPATLQPLYVRRPSIGVPAPGAGAGA